MSDCVFFSLSLLSRFTSGNPTLGSVVFNMECQGFKKLKLGFHRRLLSGWVWFGSSRGNKSHLYREMRSII